MRLKLQTRRLLLAVFILMGGIIACGLIALLPEMLSGPNNEDLASNKSSLTRADYSPKAFVSDIWSELKGGKSADQVLSAKGFLTRNNLNNIPKWAENELLDFSKKEDFYAQSDFTLITFTQEGNIANASKAILSELAQKGWTLSSCSDVTATLIKQKGECRWLMMEFIELKELKELKEQTSVVLFTAQN